MNKIMNKIKYIIVGIAVVLIIVCIITTFTVSNRLKTYKVDTLYEDLTPVEKIVSKISGNDFCTKDEAIEKGLILSDERKASEEISNIFAPISSYLITSDSEETDIKIAECEDAVLKIEKFINSDKCNTDNLKNYAYTCEETIGEYKHRLQCYKNRDLTMYKYYTNRVTEDIKEINTCVENIK